MAESNPCNYCAYLTIQNFNLAPGVEVKVDVIPEGHATDVTKEVKKIGKKFAQKKEEISKKDKKIRKILKELFVLLGHGERVKNLPEAVAKLLARNYPELVEWNGDTKLVIRIPDFYLNKAVRYVDPKRGEQLLQNCEHTIGLKVSRKEEFDTHANVVRGAMRTYWGEVPEMKLYNALKARYDENEESVAVFHGLNIGKFDPERQDNNVNEKDFILVSGSHQYIIVIEAKKTLGKGDSIEKSLKQLNETKTDLESYFNNTIIDNESWISPEWIFIPLIYCEDMEVGVNYCSSCENHIIKGTH